MSWTPPNAAQAWILLVLAGVLEVAWAKGMKATGGFNRPWAGAAVLVVAFASLHLLGRAVRALPIGTADAVWVGIDAVGTALFGMLLHAEPASAARLVCIALIVAGVEGQRLFSD